MYFDIEEDKKEEKTDVIVTCIATRDFSLTRMVCVHPTQSSAKSRRLHDSLLSCPFLFVFLNSFYIKKNELLDDLNNNNNDRSSAPTVERGMHSHDDRDIHMPIHTDLCGYAFLFLPLSQAY
jgi:hypothetical protein